MNAEPTPADLARELGVSRVRVLGFLRERWPGDAPGVGGRWRLTTAQVAEARAYFGDPHRTGRTSLANEVPIAGRYQDGWDWEGNVQAAVQCRLERDGWDVPRAPNTATREPGDDIRAERDGHVLVVEVKGYPPVGYADPRRVGEKKRTNPALQAHHWLADAVLHTLRIRGTRPEVSVAIALPENDRYRELVGEIAEPLRVVGIEVLFVTRDEVLAAVPGAV